MNWESIIRYLGVTRTGRAITGPLQGSLFAPPFTLSGSGPLGPFMHLTRKLFANGKNYKNNNSEHKKKPHLTMQLFLTLISKILIFSLFVLSIAGALQLTSPYKFQVKSQRCLLGWFRS